LISTAAYFFSFFAIITSFLGVSLSLVDFIGDGLRLKKGHKGRLLSCAITFIPPIFFVLSYQRGFIIALEYAGIFVILLLAILPACMALKIKKPTFYTTLLGRSVVIGVMVVSVAMLGIVIGNQMGLFDSLLIPYKR
jgi:tyrosine-specific transport protein